MDRATTYGERLVLAQHRAGIKQVELGRRARVAVGTIRRAVGGEFTPRAETTARLASVLGVEPSWLAFGDARVADTREGR